MSDEKTIAVPAELLDEVFDSLLGYAIQIEQEFGGGADPLEDDEIRELAALLCDARGHDYTNGLTKRINKRCRRCSHPRDPP